MVRLKKRLCVAALAAIGAVLLASCGSGSQAPTGIYGKPPPVEQYLASLGPLAPLAQQGNFLFRDVVPPSVGEYSGIAEQYRRGGLETLGTGERQSLLLIAQIAFLARTHTLRYSVEVEDRDSDPSGGMSGRGTAEEVYDLREDGPAITARRVSGENIDWPFLDRPHLHSGSSGEFRAFYRQPPAGAEWESFNAEIWHEEGGGWKCYGAVVDNVSYVFGYGMYFELLRSFALGDLLSRDAVDGNPAYHFHFTGEAVGEISYWLDANTLWLRQYEYEEDGIRYTVKLEAINEDITIEPPDVDVPCVQEEP